MAQFEFTFDDEMLHGLSKGDQGMARLVKRVLETRANLTIEAHSGSRRVAKEPMGPDEPIDRLS